MELDGQSRIHAGMSSADKLMRKFFKDEIELVKFWGPVQMCVFYLEYTYLLSDYKIVIECERGVITICVINEEGKEFSPWMIYPGVNYYHYEDRISDVEELVKLTHQAITKKEIIFLDKEEISDLDVEVFHKE